MISVNEKQLIEGVNHKQMLCVIVAFCSIELAYSLVEEGGFKRQTLEECVVAERTITAGLLLLKSLLFFVVATAVFL